MQGVQYSPGSTTSLLSLPGSMHADFQEGDKGIVYKDRCRGSLVVFRCAAPTPDVSLVSLFL